jgi:uncharacterized protein
MSTISQCYSKNIESALQNCRLSLTNVEKPGNTLIRLDLSKKIELRLREKNPRIQVVIGPRQVGKTTAVHQALAALSATQPRHYASADAVFRNDWSWVERQWQIAEQLGQDSILVLDEIQKIDNWSEVIKKLWDNAARQATKIRVVLLGSSSLASQTGLSESLTGRFELMRAQYWNFPESSEAFDYDLNQYLAFGGYPGADQYKTDDQRWLSYLKNAVVETVIDKDILQSIETVKHYLQLLEGAFLVKTLKKYSTNLLQKKSASPKILPLCPALCTFVRGEIPFSDTDRGHLFELIVGLDLLRLPGELYYWRSGSDEVDYVFCKGKKVVSIEVKSGRKRSMHGLARFKESFPKAKTLVVSPENYDAFSKGLLEFI